MVDINRVIRQAKRDVRRARRGADQSSSRESVLSKAKGGLKNVKTGARRDIRRGSEVARRKVDETSTEDVVDAIAATGAEVPEGTENDKALKRAEDTARAGAPVEGAALTPAGSPQRMEALGGGRNDVEPEGDDTMMGLVLGLEDDDASEPLLGLTPGNGGSEPVHVADNNDGTEPMEFDSPLLGIGGDDNEQDDFGGWF